MQKQSFQLTIPLAIGLLAALPGHAASVALPASAALPISSASDPGFIVRCAQAGSDVVVANSGIRALKQIDGTLTDADGNLVANVALPGPDPGGVFFTSWVNFEKDAAMFDVTTDYGATVVWNFAYPDLFPGTPGQEGNTTKFAIEAVGLVQLSTPFVSAPSLPQHDVAVLTE